MTCEDDGSEDRKIDILLLRKHQIEKMCFDTRGCAHPITQAKHVGVGVAHEGNMMLIDECV